MRRSKMRRFVPKQNDTRHRILNNNNNSSSSITLLPLFFLLLLITGTNVPFVVSSSIESSQSSSSSSSLSINNNNNDDDCHADTTRDPSLQPMTFDRNGIEEEFLVYVQPDVSTFYQKESGTMTPKHNYFNGFAGKFINLSPKVVKVLWHSSNSDDVYMANIRPFDSWGTATYPGHQFILTPLNKPKKILTRFTMTRDRSLYVYDPIATEKGGDVSSLSEFELLLYTAQKESLRFADDYRTKTGRDYLARHPRPPPIHKMWRADYFGQSHNVTTLETHFTSLPSERILRDATLPHDSSSAIILLSTHRHPDPTLTLTLTTISCAPRAFEIRHFLSDVEVDHALALATGGGGKLHRSQTDGTGGVASTRTSENTWVGRDKSPIIDAIYRRAADVLRIDESLLRRRDDEYVGKDEEGNARVKRRGSLAEELQLVHYGVGQEYTPHHDFSYPKVEQEEQGGRFATLLLYLNEGMEGGETSFPRWVNGETGGELKVKPEKGKAVLFYSMLPDGNFDDLSQHAAKPVTKGEKWLMNLWVWDPVRF